MNVTTHSGRAAVLNARRTAQCRLNPLETRDNYSTTSNNMKLVHKLLMGVATPGNLFSSNRILRYQPNGNDDYVAVRLQ